MSAIYSRSIITFDYVQPYAYSDSSYHGNNDSRRIVDICQSLSQRSPPTEFALLP